MKLSIAFALSALILAACVPSLAMVTALPTSLATMTPTAKSEWTAEPTVFFPPTEAVPSLTPTPSPFHGHLEFPFLNADAGNFQLQTGQSITFTWVEAPPDADYYEFVLYPMDGSTPTSIGTDREASNGVSVEWVVVPDLAAELMAFAHYGPEEPVLTTFPPALYSPSFPQ
jgi:hypothetical protein